MGGVGLLSFKAWKDGGRRGRKTQRCGREPQVGETVTGRGREGSRQSIAEVKTGDK